jgi:hypothetical protein
MSLAVEWKVEIGDIATPTDFTHRVTGVGIRQQLRWMRPTPTSATITLNNFDGALTPAAGGGAGTYSAVDWLSQGVYISATVNSLDTAEVFHGIITRFELIDDGTTSTVILSVVDAFTLAGRVQFGDTVTVSYLETAALGIQEMIDLAGSSLPLLGETAVEFDPYIVTDDQTGATGQFQYGVDLDFVDRPGTLNEILVQNVMPSNLTLSWSTRIRNDVVSGYASYEQVIVGATLNRFANVSQPAHLAPRKFTLVETTPASGELTFTKLEMGYDVDGRYNLSKVTSVATYPGQKTFEYEDAALRDSYGSSQYRATNTINATETSTKTQAQAIVNRFGPVVFTVNQVELTTPNLADNPSDSSDELAALLDSANLWQRVDIEYTPTGAGSSKTVEGIIFGRQINIQPGRASIIVDVVPAELWTTFVLDSSTLGVLDTDRLG